MTLQEIKNQLPTGAIKELASRTKLSQTTISQVLNGKLETRKKAKILQATADLITEYRAKEQEATEALQKAIGTDI